MGSVVEVLEHRQCWLNIRLPDTYVGWIHESLVHLSDQQRHEHWISSPKVMVTSRVALIRSGRQPDAVPVSDAVIGTEITVLESTPDWTRVGLPDGRQGWIAQRDISDEEGLIHLDGSSPEDILRTARSFTGIPYLWGGISPKGFDCSGFVQTVFRLNGIELPRDSYQQFAVGEKVAGRSDLKPADLIFFQPEGADRITHVAICGGGGQFTHCSGYVRTNSLEREAEDYDASLDKNYAGAKRVAGGMPSEC